MNKVINTKKYRIGKEITGVGGTRSLISNFSNKFDAFEAIINLKNETGWNYYVEEEVIYHGSQRDKFHNLVDSAPTWRRIYNSNL